jgi:hypothetical protein
MDERRLLLAMPPFWRGLIIDLTLGLSWAACVGICVPLMQLATDHPVAVCIVESLAPGTLLFWGAVAAVQLWCAAAARTNRR